MENETTMTAYVREYGDDCWRVGVGDKSIRETVETMTERGAFKAAMRMVAAGEAECVNIETGWARDETLDGKGLAEWFLRLYDDN